MARDLDRSPQLIGAPFGAVARVLVALSLALPLAATAMASQEPAPEVRTVELFPGSTDGPPENPVTLTFRGRFFAEGGWLSRLEDTDAELTASQRFLASALETYRAGTLEEVLTLWLPEDRAGVSELFADPDIFRQNQAFYRRLLDTAFVGEMWYGPSYKLLFVQHTGSGFEDFIKVYPLIEVDGKLLLTNRLQADPVFVYFANAYKDSLPLQERAQGEGN
jgi:hypothetical protein